MRLHLGCGNSYLEGYTNVELPQNTHLKADVYEDLTKLKYDDESVSEILISHVFEHFDRPTALSLLIKWNHWLRTGGKLTIVVPDFEVNISNFKALSFDKQQPILRHIFGSHEADWAIHRDGWYAEKFKFILEKLGFAILSIESLIVNSDPMRYDIRIMATKSENMSGMQALLMAKSIMSMSLLGDEPEIAKAWNLQLCSALGVGEAELLLLNGEFAKENPNRQNRLALFFSKDRASQLDCTLGTFFRHCTDASGVKVIVLYTSSDFQYEMQYMRLADFYPQVQFVRETSFRNNVMFILSEYDYCLLGVDDCIFTRDFSYNDPMSLLDSDESLICVSLRLGKNISYCYMLDKLQSIPEYTADGKFLIFDWTHGEYDFGYPLEISSSIYRADDIYNVIARVDFVNPNSMEIILHQLKDVLNKPLLACYNQNVAFCNPVNVVQSNIHNRHGSIPSHVLARQFHEGYRIDYSKFDGFENEAPHQETGFELVNKNITSNSPLISIIIPTFNGHENLEHCLHSVFRNTNESYEVIVVDNNKDDLTEQLVAKYPVTYIKNAQNLGPAIARNQALRVSKGEFIAFLDDDVVVPANWSSKFLRYMQVFQQVGMIGAKSNCASGLQLVSDCNYNNLYEFEKFARDFSKYDRGLVNTIRLVTFCVFMQKHTVEKIGALDESFGLYGFEDDDYSLRARIAGLNPTIAKDIFVHHTGGPLKYGDQTYMNAMHSAWGVYKKKWGIPESVPLHESFDYREIVHQPFDPDKHYIKL